MGKKSGELLIVEDNPGDYAHYIRMLDAESHDFTDFRYINDLDEAVDYLTEHSPRCCLLDYRFPGGSAKDLIQQLHQRLHHIECPLVIITGQGNERLAVELRQLGVQDYLSKDKLSSSELVHTLKNAMRMFDLESEVHRLAHYDNLTGTLARSLFMDRLEHAVTEAHRYQLSVSLICLDIDYFKQINELHGYDTGDTVLKTCAERIEQCIRESDSVARLNADEFVVLLPHCSLNEGEQVVEKLMDSLPGPITVDNRSVEVTISLGLATYPDTADNYQILFKQADVALAKAKEQGRGQAVTYVSEKHSFWRRRDQLLRALPQAISNNQLKLAYQPVLHLPEQTCHHVEALVRWQHEGEWLPTAEIVELIQQGPMLIPFHEWLFNESFQQLKTWQASNPQLKVAVNMPASIAHNKLLQDKLHNALDKHGLPPSSVILEITALHLARNPTFIKETLDDLIARGINIIIDDFATGSGFMEYLMELPCIQLKIDKHFLLEWHQNPNHRKALEAFTALGHSLGMEVTAKGVANRELLEAADAVGCDNVQGFECGKPRFGGQSWEDFMDQSQNLSSSSDPQPH